MNTSKLTAVMFVCVLLMPGVCVAVVKPCDPKVRGPHGYGDCRHCTRRINPGKQWKQARRWTDASGTSLVHLACYSRAVRHGPPTSLCGVKRPRSPVPPDDEQPQPTEQQQPEHRERKLILVLRADPTPVPDLRPLFREFGHVRVPATSETRLLAHRVMQMPRRSKRGVTISGNTRQLELSDEDDGILQSWHHLVRETATRLGIDATQMHIVDPKLLLTGATSGFDQAVHFDCERGQAASSKFSVLLFCSSGHMGTALPRFPVSHELSFSSEAQHMQRVAHLLDPAQYESLPAMQGDIIFFAESTPHYGVRNSCSQGDRVVLFSILSPSAESMQDAHQVFPWLFVGDAFGWTSKEFAQALVDNRRHRPVSSIRSEDARWGSEAIAVLKAHGLFDLYNS